MSALASYGLVLVIGLMLGIWLGSWREGGRREVLRFSETVGRGFLLNQHAHVQYCEGEYSAAVDALSAWLLHLEAVTTDGGRDGDPLMTPRGVAVDKALALGRLALLEERSGKVDTAAGYWRRAEAEARHAAWKDPSEARIRAVIARLEDCPKPAAKP